MCPADDAFHTIEFSDYYVIKPSITFNRSINYETSLEGEQGKLVPPLFEYNSYNNPNYLTVEQIKELNIKLGL